MTKGSLKNPSILIIDDQGLIRKSLKVALEKEKYCVELAETGAFGLAKFKQKRFDLVLLDIRLPDTSGIDVLKQMKSLDRNPIVIMMTGYGTIENAVLAMKLGAFDYINKPFKTESLTALIKMALAAHADVMRNGKRSAEGELADFEFENSQIIGRSRSVMEMLELAKKYSRIDSTVLIQGESGTGKELVARAIHANSIRRSGPFVEINCSAIPYTLLESELFGFEPGAFTDAKKIKKGLIEQAHGGTLFLDEIGDMEIGIQAKMLNVLQERKFRRLGGTRTMDMSARIVAATNHDLKEGIRNNRFRQDLFYRLNVLNIFVPPLRERKEDIIILAEYFIGEFNERYKRDVKGIDDAAAEAMRRFTWPGNVRELRNVMERIVIVNSPEYIGLKDLPMEISMDGNETLLNQALMQGYDFDFPENGINFKKYVDSFQVQIIRKALLKSGGNKSQAAKLLNIDRFSLHYLINKLDIH
jgi:two-component system, NtrC family, response regulator AtoC